MFKTPVYHDPFGRKFDEWAEATLSGTWELTLDVESYMEFSHEEDMIIYMITWYQTRTYSTGREAGAFYCPYVPTRLS